MFHLRTLLRTIPWVSSLSLVPRGCTKEENKDPGYIRVFAERKKDVVKHQKIASITKKSHKNKDLMLTVLVHFYMGRVWAHCNDSFDMRLNYMAEGLKTGIVHCLQEWPVTSITHREMACVLIEHVYKCLLL